MKPTSAAGGGLSTKAVVREAVSRLEYCFVSLIELVVVKILSVDGSTEPHMENPTAIQLDDIVPLVKHFIHRISCEIWLIDIIFFAVDTVADSEFLLCFLIANFDVLMYEGTMTCRTLMQLQVYAFGNDLQGSWSLLFYRFHGCMMFWQSDRRPFVRSLFWDRYRCRDRFIRWQAAIQDSCEIACRFWHEFKIQAKRFILLSKGVITILCCHEQGPLSIPGDQHIKQVIMFPASLLICCCNKLHGQPFTSIFYMFCIVREKQIGNDMNEDWRDYLSFF